MFSSKTVSDITESIIHSHRRFIHVRRFTSTHKVNGEESNRKYIQFFFILKLQGFARLFAAMACVNLVFPPQKLNSNEGDLMRLFIFSFVVQLTVQLSKLKGLGKTH